MTAPLDAEPRRPMATDLGQLRTHAGRIRERIIRMCAGPEGGHLGGSLSLADVLTALYFRVLRVSPSEPEDPGRDVLLLSKGHAAIGLYATLAERGFLAEEELSGYGQPQSRLTGHPTRKVPGVEMPTGSLGHGLALGTGFALSARLDRRERRAFVVLGDGELQEGSVWEAVMAAASLRLDNLIAIIDRNLLQLTGTTESICRLEPLAERWVSFGWAARTVDGHDLGQVVSALAEVPWMPGRPSVLIAQTQKGRGVPFVAGDVRSHYVKFSPRMVSRALASSRQGDADE